MHGGRGLSLLALALLAATAGRAQSACAVPEEPSALSQVTAGTSERGEGLFFQIDQSGAFNATETVRSRRGLISRSRVGREALEKAAEREGPAREIYRLAREILCSVRFPDASTESIGVTADGVHMDGWILVGDAFA